MSRQLGFKLEGQAKRYLKRQGLRHILQNYNSPYGEIDLILSHHNTLVFVEVKYRQNAQHGHAAEMVTPTKQRRIIQSAMHYLQSHPNLKNCPIRFDVLAMEGWPYRIQWIQNAFEHHR